MPSIMDQYASARNPVIAFSFKFPFSALTDIQDTRVTGLSFGAHATPSCWVVHQLSIRVRSVVLAILGGWFHLRHYRQITGVRGVGGVLGMSYLTGRLPPAATTSLPRFQRPIVMVRSAHTTGYLVIALPSRRLLRGNVMPAYVRLRGLMCRLLSRAWPTVLSRVYLPATEFRLGGR